jgi:hypothetical protein
MGSCSDFLDRVNGKFVVRLGSGSRPQDWVPTIAGYGPSDCGRRVSVSRHFRSYWDGVQLLVLYLQHQQLPVAFVMVRPSATAAC